MDIYTLFLDWKNQYNANNNMIQSKLQIQYNLTTNGISIKLPIVFLTELEQKNFTICIETQDTSDSQSNLEKEK